MTRRRIGRPADLAPPRAPRLSSEQCLGGTVGRYDIASMFGWLGAFAPELSAGRAASRPPERRRPLEAPRRTATPAVTCSPHRGRWICPPPRAVRRATLPPRRRPGLR